LLRRYQEQLETLLGEHVLESSLWDYGSRVNRRSHDGSDLDLALSNPILKSLGYEYVEPV